MHFLFNSLKKNATFLKQFKTKNEKKRISFLTRPTKNADTTFPSGYGIYEKISKMSSWGKLYRLKKFPKNTAVVT